LFDNPGPAGVQLPSTVVLNPASITSSALGGRSNLSATMPNPYLTSAPQSTAPSWDKPRSAYLRADAAFARIGNSANGAVSSNRGAGGLSLEGGVRLVQGRLMVGNGNGSELLKLPLTVSAQYWTGNSWDTNVNDSASPVSAANPQYRNCLKYLSVNGVCKTSVLSLSGSGNLSSGQRALWLAAPGQGNFGSAQVILTGAPAWLPPTIGVATFGVYRSPLIYIREVY
jgi:hypothetical protein